MTDQTLDRYTKPFKVVDEGNMCYTFVETTQEGVVEIERIKKEAKDTIIKIRSELYEAREYLTSIDEYSVLENTEFNTDK